MTTFLVYCIEHYSKIEVFNIRGKKQRIMFLYSDHYHLL